MFGNGVTIIFSRVTTYSRRAKTQWVQRLALYERCGVVRGATSPISLVPLAAVGTTLFIVAPASGFGWLGRWTNSVVIPYVCKSAFLHTVL